MNWLRLLGSHAAGLAVCCGLVLASAGVVDAHDPPPISFQVKLTDEELESFVMIQAPLFKSWMNAEGHDCDVLDAEWLESREPVIAEFMHTFGPVAIDQIAVLPIIEVLDFQEGFQVNDGVDYVALTIVYSTKGKPRTLTMEWHRFVAADGWPLDKAEMLFGYQRKLQDFEFKLSTPRFTWIAPSLDVAPEDLDPTAYMLEPLPLTRLPLLSLSVLAALLLIVPVLALVRADARAYIFTFSTAILIGGLGANVGVVERVLPWVERPPPTEKAAVQIFEALHRNIYRAFDYVTESEVYDVLALSVTEELLAETYAEVYDSLVLREDGGAVCRVRGVERLLARPLEIGRDRMEMLYRWRVTGTVNHWGHMHLRTNEYTARYTLAADATQWRITAVDIASQQRVDDSGTESD